MSGDRAAGVGSSAARIVLLVTASVFINYIDRGNLSTAAPLVQDDLRLTPGQLGALFSAFSISYVLFMPATGWLADRFGAKIVLGAGVAIWSIATLSMGFAAGFAGLLGLRLLLGVGESCAFPCATKIIADAVKVGRLGIANGVMGFGYLLGPAVGTLIGGYIMTIADWRASFLVFGALSLMWLLPWRTTIVVRAPVKVEEASSPAPSFREILSRRALWGASLGHFASNYVYYFILNWLPFYLVKSRGFSIESMAAVTFFAYALNAGSALFMGWLADRWIKAGVSATLIYKSIMGVTHVVAFACMVGMLLLPERGCVAALYIFCVVAGFSYPGIFAIPQIIAGPRATGRWVGVQNAVGNVAGIVAPYVTGRLVDRTGLFDVAFGLAAAVNIFGFIGWVVILPKVAPLKWRTAS
jgi:MFS family permease